MNWKSSFVKGTLCSIVALAAAAPAAAQSVFAEDIVITAQKREQNLQDVGISVTAYSGDQLRALGVTESPDIATFTPGVHISGNLAGQNTQLTIRGVTQNDFNDIVEAPNAAYLDEGYIAIAQAQTFAVFDIERVEVLKGPQGTLFGRNATGGLVHYISNKPSFEGFEGFVDMTVGIHDSPGSPGKYRLEAGFGGPIIADKLAVRAAVLYNKLDPLLKNEYPSGAVGGSPGPGAGADLGDDDTLAGRFTVDFRPADTVTMRLAFNGSRTRVSTGPYQQKPTIGVFDASGELINVQDVGPTETRASIGPNGTDPGSDLNNDGIFGGPGELVGRPAGADFFGYIDPDGDGFRTAGDFAFGDSGKADTWGVNFRTEWEINDAITMTAVSDYKDYKKLLFIDVDAGPANQAANYGAVDASSFTQEIRFSGETDTFNWVAGLFYLNIDTDSDNGLKFPVGSVVPGAPFDVATDAFLKTNSYSAFGQVEWDFADQWTLIAGGRFIQEEKDYLMTQSLYFTQNSREIQQGTPVPIGPVYTSDGVPFPFEDTSSQSLWAGKLQLEYRPNDDILLYAGINRGVKAGSYNAPLNGGIPAPPSFLEYGSEILWSYEAGFKYTLAGNTRINGTVFYYDYKDYQSFLFTGVAGYVVNADATNVGGELELITSPLPGLDLSIGASVFDATVKDVPLRLGGPIIRDVKPTYAPELQISGLARYGWDMFGGEMAINADFQYSDSYYYNLRNFDADKFDSYFIAGLGIAWTSPEDTVKVAFNIDNITDERVGIQGFDLAGLCGCNEVSYKPPRSFSLNVRLQY